MDDFIYRRVIAVPPALLNAYVVAMVGIFVCSCFWNIRSHERLTVSWQLCVQVLMMPLVFFDVPRWFAAVMTSLAASFAEHATLAIVCEGSMLAAFYAKRYVLNLTMKKLADIFHSLMDLDPLKYDYFNTILFVIGFFFGFIALLSFITRLLHERFSIAWIIIFEIGVILTTISSGYLELGVILLIIFHSLAVISSKLGFFYPVIFFLLKMMVAGYFLKKF
ncbi:unnamed protein product [Caenorhabditis auriculariae]|uniref:Uncharacterized protein n=1 Tax=Caenorhabditis auriculariae TaxID=2777116 RepID=A0A8S1GUZ8_9PELO|nr:unnamed protein product [Caenorhabditis auriculariae]